MKEFMLRILETDEEFYSGKCISIVVPTTEGMYGIMANHTNLFAALTTGVMKYVTADNEVCYASISGGMIKVENNEVLILADSAERPEEIDLNRAHAEQSEAESLLQNKKDEHIYRSAEAMMQRAINRIKLKKRFGDYK